jgi:DNA modification methylase
MKTLDNTNIELIPVDALKPYANNARSHSPAQIKQIARSIERFGFTNPVLADKNFGIIAGHGRVLAAKSLGYAQVPVLRVSHLSDTEKRAYILADNKLALNAGWDKETLAIELQGLIDAEFDVQLTGFSIGESDIILNDAHEASLAASDEPEDAIPEPGESCPVTRPGDIWQLGRHRLICGDARNAEACAALLQGEKADMIFTDPPYNVPIDGHVSGLGAVKHREFAFASGEMSTEAFTTFLTVTLGQSATLCRDGAIAFVCMDWRHMGELLSAGHKVFTELKNLCVWNKTNGGMGTFYRSKYELVFVYKIGTAAHINTFGLGDGGRYRTNVWDYAGANTFRRERMEDLADHPTVKPVALVADAIRDVSKRGGIVLDPFGGSGTTLIAAEKTGRKARLIEVDPVYCDVIVRRYETYAGKQSLRVNSSTPVEA